MTKRPRTPKASRQTRRLTRVIVSLTVIAASVLVAGASAATRATPANTTLPLVTGTSQQGKTVTAQTGSWSGTNPIVFSYQWRHCDAAGATCANIAGATGQTYSLAGPDVGSTVRVAVTATNGEGTATALSDASAVVSGLNAPSATSAPVISGTAREGQQVTTSDGTWNGSQPITFSYQWLICDNNGNACHDISGATSQAYTVRAGDKGNTLRVTVKATNAGGSTSAVSGSSSGVASSDTAPASTAAPSLTGTATVGSVLKVNPGTWSGSTPFTFSYGWQRCDLNGSNCADIAGAASDSYTLTAADVANRIRGAVTAANGGGKTGAFSAPSTIVNSLAPVNKVLPVITGSPAINQTLTASNGSWVGTSPFQFSYQWARSNDKNGYDPIAGATQKTYKPTAADLNRKLYMQVKAQNAYGPNWATSAPTEVVTQVATPAGTVPIAAVTLPNRLVISDVKFDPLVVTTRVPFQARFRITDSAGHPVQGALVYTIGLPYGWIRSAHEQATGADGWATITITPTTQLPLGQRRALVMFVRARNPGGSLLAGVSTRRLVQVTLR